MAIHVILDTNFVFKKNLWEPFEMAAIQEAAKTLGAKIWIPEGVQEEWKHYLKIRVRDDRDDLSSLANRAIEYGIDIKPEKFDLEKAFKTLVEKNATFAKDNGIQILPHASAPPSLSELFKLAVLKAPPFDSAGNAFRDAMIVLSVNELASKNSKDELYLVTSDKGLKTKSDFRFEAKNITVTNGPDLKKKLEELQGNGKTRTMQDLSNECLEFIATKKFGELREIISQATFQDRTSFSLEVLEIEEFANPSPKYVTLAKLPKRESDEIFFVMLVKGTLRYRAKPGPLYNPYALIHEPITRMGDIMEHRNINYSGLLGLPFIKEETCELDVFGTVRFQNQKIAGIEFSSANEPRKDPSEKAQPRIG